MSRRVSPSVVNSAKYVERFRQRLNDRYEAAQTNDENENHWSLADSVEIGRNGTPTRYHRLREHPGGFTGSDLKGDWIKAKDMIHLFR